MADRRRAAWRVVRWTLGALAAVVVGFLVLFPTGRYVARAAYEEARILARRVPIATLLADPDTDARTRAKLELVLEARRYAADTLQLTAKKSFTTYSHVASDTLVLVLSAAYRDQLRFRTWWFPIVGSVPYKGFFDFAAAERAARDVERAGYDAYLRPASAFSTLGFFNDPLLSTTLSEDSASLANTVIHELTHNTFYAPGQAVFNESFANFVGTHGAEQFFAARGDAANAAEERRDWEREKLLGRFWGSIYNALDSAFKAHAADRAARLAARDTIFAAARARFTSDVAPRLPGYRPGMTIRLTLDNASLLARRVYRTGLDDFDAVLAREGGNLRRATTRIIALARSRPKDPYGALREWLASPVAEAPTQ